MNFIYDPSLVLYVPLYQLDGASFMSRDAYGQLCTVTGALWRPNGRYFDGVDDFISVPDHADLTFGTGDFTAGGWCRTDGGTTYWQIIVAKGWNAAGKWKVGEAAKGGDEIIAYGDGGNLACTTSGATFSDGCWHHLMFVRKGNDAYVYFDSAKLGTQTGIPGSNFNASDNVTIGAADATHGFMNGNIGEVWIYNRALNPMEIQHNYLATKERYR